MALKPTSQIFVEIKDGIFMCKLFDERDPFSFEIVQTPFICSNIPSNIFYGTIFSEILRIVALAPCDFRISNLDCFFLFRRMKKQGASRCYIIYKQINNKGFLRYSEVLVGIYKTINMSLFWHIYSFTRSFYIRK